MHGVTTASLQKKANFLLPPGILPVRVLPRMSDSLSKLMALSEDEKSNLSLLELLISKDPVAIVRIIQLANTANFGRSKQVQSVYEALMVMGSVQAVEALMALWTVQSFELPSEMDFVRNYLVRHTFSTLTTVRRFVTYGGYKSISAHDSQMLTLVAKISAGLVLLEPLGLPGQDSLIKAATDNSHSLLHDTSLAPTFAMAETLGKEWGLPAQCTDVLGELGTWRDLSFPRATITDMLLLSELMFDSPEDEESNEEWTTAVEQNMVFQQLKDKNINPKSLVFQC